jgi:DNA-binding NarL/FixJ family response regulator
MVLNISSQQETNERFMQQAHSSSNVASQTGQHSGRAKSILVVEDHEVYRNVVRTALLARLPEFKVLEAGSVASALAVLEGGEIALMLVDMTLPDGSAVDLVQNAQAFTQQGLKTIVFSNHSSADMMPVLSRDDVHGYVPKEAGLKALADAVSKTLQISF